MPALNEETLLIEKIRALSDKLTSITYRDSEFEDTISKLEEAIINYTKLRKILERRFH